MPHPIAEERIWETQGEEKRAAVQKMFSSIAPGYDRLNSLISLSLHHSWRRKAVEKLQLGQGETVLDLCCGTGDFIEPLGQKVGPSGVILGLDFCQPMLEVAKSKGVLQLGLGDACQLPVPSASVNAVTVGWGLRNVSQLQQALSEIARVLKPGGRLVSLDMAVPKNPFLAFGSRMFTQKVVPFFGKLFGQADAYTYLPKSTEGFVTPEELKQKFEEAGLSDVKIQRLLMGNIALVWGSK